MFGTPNLVKFPQVVYEMCLQILWMHGQTTWRHACST